MLQRGLRNPIDDVGHENCLNEDPRDGNHSEPELRDHPDSPYGRPLRRLTKIDCSKNELTNFVSAGAVVLATINRQTGGSMRS